MGAWPESAQLELKPNERLSAIRMKPNERLSAIRKEDHARRNRAYIVEEKGRNTILIGQKLAGLVTAINEIVEDTSDSLSDRVSLTRLHQIIGNSGERVGGWTKHRWRVEQVSIDEAAAAFESARERFANALIVGTRRYYTTTCV